MATAREQLAAALKQARLAAGIRSQGALAARMTVSRAVVNKAESATQPVPTDDTITGWARVCGVPENELAELAERCKSGLPEWFADYLLAEQAATRLRFWGPNVFPGLTQAEAYTRALEPVTDAVVARQAERQKQALGRAHVTVVIAERVLSECVGSPAVMAEQCAHTADLAESGKIRLHVVPAGAVVGFGGAVAIAVKDGHVTVNFTVLTRDIPTTATAVTDEVMSAFEALMGAALPAAESVGCVRRWEAIWKEQT